MSATDPFSLDRYLEQRRDLVEEALLQLMPAAEGPARRVIEAARYAVLGGGKRLRPVLALATCEACGGSVEPVVAPACALELLHTYSLVHDDLPAMDNDDLRRGRPTVHRAYDEAIAILAGDALHTLAFEILATRPEDADPGRRADAVRLLAERAGLAGMVGGQMADLEGEQTLPDLGGLQWIHSHKTGGLFAASAEIGALHAGADASHRRAASRFGAALGLAFQIADDLLDRTATAEDLGKTPGKDERSGKATYPALLGVEASRRLADSCIDEALTALGQEAMLSEALEGLARFAVARTR